ncbi:MarR family winged helix-turn-helix transcriptional regulator [Streptomyces sp. NPDC058439]|uniref:MarR family winged helix-turn-helix transcriptional regulator n=1 Tax=Streptomyces sp. NPDC058439 TaxID=3346500 RepID=UPI003655A8C9
MGPDRRQDSADTADPDRWGGSGPGDTPHRAGTPRFVVAAVATGRRSCGPATLTVSGPHGVQRRVVDVPPRVPAETGHVRRCPDPGDRRAVLVKATDDSCALHSDVQPAWTNLEERTLAGLDTAEREEPARLLAKVEENLCHESENGPGLR